MTKPQPPLPRNALGVVISEFVPQLRNHSFTVYGRAQQRGSKIAIVTRSGKAVAIDSNKKSKAWMQGVAQVVGNEFNEMLIDRPVVLTARFYFARPKIHYGTGRNAATLKASAPVYHGQSPDLAKLLRSLEDALTGVLWTDDKRVAFYGPGTGRYWCKDSERVAFTVEVLHPDYGHPPNPGYDWNPTT